MRVNLYKLHFLSSLFLLNQIKEFSISNFYTPSTKHTEGELNFFYPLTFPSSQPKGLEVGQGGQKRNERKVERKYFQRVLDWKEEMEKKKLVGFKCFLLGKVGLKHPNATQLQRACFSWFALSFPLLSFSALSYFVTQLFHFFFLLQIFVLFYTFHFFFNYFFGCVSSVLFWFFGSSMFFFFFFLICYFFYLVGE